MGGKPEGKGESEYERIRGEGKKWEMAGENSQKFPGLPWDPHVYGYGVGMGMIFHPHRPVGILWGFLINLK